MTRWIRWPGLIAFVVIVAVVGGFWYLFVDDAVEYVVETAGSRAVGAKVELDSVDLTLFPLGLEMNRLAVANPKQPMRNALEADAIRMRFNTGWLIKRRMVIENAAVSGVSFDTKRKSSGALPEEKADETKGVGVGEKIMSPAKKLPSLSLESAEAILEKEKLTTVAEAETLQDDIQSARKRFEQRLDSLPDEKTFRTYEKRLKKLRDDIEKPGGLFGAVGKADEIRKLKADIEKDLDALKKARAELKNTRSRLRGRIDALRAAPAKDVDRLMSKYGLSPEGLGNLSALVFGPKYAQWVETGLEWYLRLQPYLAQMGKSEPVEPEKRRGRGVDVEFALPEPVPDFWIKALDASASVPAGRLAGRINDICSDQTVLNRPLTFDFSGDELKNAAGLDITGHLDRTDPGNPEDLATVDLKQMPLSDLQLLDQSAYKVSMESAQLNAADGRIRIAGKTLDAQIKAGVGGARFRVASDQSGGALADGFAEVLEGIRRFDVSLTLAGRLSNPDIRIQSDMDEQLSAGLKKVIGQQQAKLKRRLKQEITGRAENEINAVKSELSGFQAIEKALENRLDTGSGILDAIPGSLG